MEPEVSGIEQKMTELKNKYPWIDTTADAVIAQIFEATGLMTLMDNKEYIALLPGDVLLYIRRRLQQYSEAILVALRNRIQTKYGDLKTRLLDNDVALFNAINKLKETEEYSTDLNFKNQLNGLSANAFKLQVNTIIYNCHRIEEGASPEVGGAIKAFVDALTDKIKTLNKFHSEKRNEPHLAIELEQKGGDPVEQQLILQLFIEFFKLFNRENFFTNNELNNMANDIIDVDSSAYDNLIGILQKNPDILNKDYNRDIGNIVEQLITIDKQLEDDVNAHNGFQELFESYKNLYAELIKLQINVLLIHCKPEVRAKKIPNPPIDKISQKLLQLSDLQAIKDRNYNGLANAHLEPRGAQEGGSFYRRKYNKYKSKYLFLKKQIH